MKHNLGKGFSVLTGAAAVIVVIGTGALVMSQPATATVQFATQTGKTCGDCHTNAKGGGPLTALGEKFKANGNKMPN